MDSSGPVWLDIEPLLNRLSAELDPGQLVHGPHFNLFEAMSAVEVGNPKMDPGAQPQKPSLPLDASAPVRLSNMLTLKVLDQLMAQQTSWLAGNTLPQTIFTCLYLFHSERVEHNQVLRVVCKAVKVSCSLIKDLAYAAGVTREDDFNPHAGSQRLGPVPREGAANLSASLQAAEERIATAERLASSHQASTSREGAIPPEDPCWQGLKSRLRFQRFFIQALFRLQTATRSDFEQAHKLVASAEAELAQMEATCAPEHLRDDYSLGFDLDANRGELGPTPPRSAEPIPLADMWPGMRALLLHLRLLCDLPKVDSWGGLQAFLQDFAAYKPGPVPRSLLHCALLKMAASGGLQYGPSRSMLLRAMGLAPYIPSYPAEVETYLEQALIVAREWCQAMCLSHARVGRSLRSRMLNWQALSTHAVEADLALAQSGFLQSHGWEYAPPGAQGLLAAWVEREAAEVQAQILLLGFETDVYAPPDYLMIYWYCDFLFAVVGMTSQQLLGAFPRPLHSAVGATKIFSSHSSSKSGRKHKGKPEAQQLYDGLRASTSAAAEQATLFRLLAQGCAWLAMAVDLAGLQPRHAAVFNTRQQRFEQRLGFCLRCSVPPPQPFLSLDGVYQSAEGEVPAVLSNAREQFTRAKQLLLHSTHSPSQHAGLQQIVIKNLVAVTLLSRMLETGDRSRLETFHVTWDFCQHPCFPVVGIKSSR